MTDANGASHILRCVCGMEWGRIENGVLRVESRHKGETHTNTIALLEACGVAFGEDWVYAHKLALEIMESIKRAAKKASLGRLETEEPNEESA